MMKHRIPIHQYTVSQISLREYDFQQVQKILGGAQELWDPLYQAVYQIVVRCAAKADHNRLLKSDDYRDITDEAFTTCYTQLERYKGWSRFSYWVGGYAKNITRNRCARELTKIRNKKLLENAASCQMAYCDPLLTLIRLERDQFLWKAFFDLPIIDQKIVAARIFKNIAPRTLAHDLQLSRKEVLTRYDLAIIILRLHYRRYYPNGQLR